jgi:hypothetical protein
MVLLSVALAADLSFVVVGDTQAVDGDSVNMDVVPTLVEDMNALAPDLAFFVGDLTNGASSLPRQVEVWEEWIDATSGLECERYAVAGNHDFFPGPGVKEAWADAFDWLPRDTSPAGEEALSYWFDVGDVRFVSILSDGDYGVNVEPDNAWLEPVLASSIEKAHVFVFTHHPISWSTYDTAMGGTEGDFWQLLLQYEADALLAGHWHLYQPGQLGGGEMAGGHAGSAETWEIIGGLGGGWQGYDPVRESNLGYGFIHVEVAGDTVTARYYRDEDGDGHYDDVADEFDLTYARTRPRGLVAWYPLDADLSDEAPAEVGYGIDAVPLGDAALVDDPVRGAVLALDGDGDAAETSVINAYHLSLKGDLTVALWARADALGPGEWDNALLAYATNDYYTEDEETNYAYWLSMQADGRLRAFWEWGDGRDVVLDSSEAVPVDGTWHQLGFVRDTATQTLTFYADGEALGDPVSFSRLPSGASRGFLYLGADTVDNDASYWSGALDEVCLFDRVLTAAEVAAIHADGGCGAFANPMDTGDPTDTSGTDSAATTDSAPAGSEEAGGGTAAKTPEGCGCAAADGPGGGLALLVVAGLRRRWARRAPALF